MIKFRVLTLVIILSAFSLTAQDFKSAIRQLQEKYKTIDNMHVIMNVSIFNGAGSHHPSYTFDVDIKRSGNNFLYHFGENDMLMNEKYLVMVDRAGKAIVYSNRDPKAEAAMKGNFQLDLDSLLSFYKEPKYLGNQDGVHHYQVDEKRGQIKTMDLFVRDDSKLIEKIIYIYTEGQKVSITFETFDLKPLFDEKTFDETQYITVVKGKAIPATTFKGYEVDRPEYN